LYNSWSIFAQSTILIIVQSTICYCTMYHSWSLCNNFMVVNHCTKHHLLLHNALSLVVECTIHYCLMHHGSLPITPCTIVQYTIYHYQVHHHTPFIIAQYSSIIVQCTIVFLHKAPSIIVQNTIQHFAVHYWWLHNVLSIAAQRTIYCCTRNHWLMCNALLVNVQSTVSSIVVQQTIHHHQIHYPLAAAECIIFYHKIHHPSLHNTWSIFLQSTILITAQSTIPHYAKCIFPSSCNTLSIIVQCMVNHCTIDWSFCNAWLILAQYSSIIMQYSVHCCAIHHQLLYHAQLVIVQSTIHHCTKHHQPSIVAHCTIHHCTMYQPLLPNTPSTQCI